MLGGRFSSEEDKMIATMLESIVKIRGEMTQRML
jgi:hypothetical protein